MLNGAALLGGGELTFGETTRMRGGGEQTEKMGESKKGDVDRRGGERKRI